MNKTIKSIYVMVLKHHYSPAQLSMSHCGDIFTPIVSNTMRPQQWIDYKEKQMTKQDCVVKCMVCRQPLIVEAWNSASFATLAMLASSHHNWQFTWINSGTFLCCPGCVDEAYEDNGSLGFLKEEHMEKLVPHETKY